MASGPSMRACCERPRPGATVACGEHWEVCSISHDHIEGTTGGDYNFQIGECDFGTCGQAAVWKTASVLRSTSFDGFAAIFIDSRSASHDDY